MKTKNYFRIAALAVMMIMTASFAVGHNKGDNETSLNFEKTEFANAGYWIDPVVVTTISGASDEELLTGKGYYIEPVVVTYDADKAMLADKGYYIEPVVVSAQTDVTPHVFASK
jgi:hypothetical protein